MAVKRSDIVWEQIKSPRKLAQWMWTAESLKLAPNEFLRLYRRIRASCEESTTLWQLGGATNDYLRQHPNAFAAPVDLARRLLISNHRDARVIGLKLLRRSKVSDGEFLTAVAIALEKKSDYEACGGLHELNCWLDTPKGQRSNLNANHWRRIKKALQRLATSSRADYVIETATTQLQHLQDLF